MGGVRGLVEGNGGIRGKGGGGYEIHGCAEDEDEVLVRDGVGGGQEEVGGCEVEDGKGADDGGGGDDGHFCWNGVDARLFERGYDNDDDDDNAIVNIVNSLGIRVYPLSRLSCGASFIDKELKASSIY